jgi:TctA family transporter
MTDIVHLLGLGFGAALTPSHLWYCFVGATIGTFIGVLPGLGPIATMAMLLPLTYYLQTHRRPHHARRHLLRLAVRRLDDGDPHAPSGRVVPVVTCLDGYEMARRGRAGAALATAALALFFAGTFSTLLIAFFSPPLTAVLLGLVGADVNTGLNRFTFGVPELRDGIGIAVVSMGVFGIAEIVLNLTKKEAGPARKHEISSLRITRDDFRLAWPAAVRGTAIGAMLGILPGGGAMIGSFAAYSVEKRLSRTPERFGRGAIEGVAAPEAANNAGAQASFIPMLALGIPSNAVMAMMAGAMLIHGIAPSPNLATAQPELFWGLIVSMWIGNLMLLAINLPLIRLWVHLLAVPYGILFPAILVFCCIGIYTVNTSAFEIALMAGFGVFGVVLALLRCPPAPLVLAFILGPMMEENLRRAMLLSGGNAGVFLNPISLAFLAAAGILLALILLPSFRTVRAVAADE